jgi:type IV pilus assembly protein PilC
VLQKIRGAVESGSSLSDALRLAPRTFDEMIIQQIRIGERCGNLDKALLRICEGLDRGVEVRKRIVKKISYPLLVTLAGTGLTIFMITFVVPEFESVYAGSQVELPKVTQVVTGTSRLVMKWGPFAIAGLIGTLFGLQRLRNQGTAGVLIDAALLKIPLVGAWLRDAAVLQFSESLLTMVDSGYTPADAVKAAVPCVKNRAIRHTVDEVRQAVQRGERISTVLSRYDRLFPATFCQLVGVGEQSGDFGKAMQGAVKHLRESVEARVDAGLSIIEPALTIGLAGIVGSIVLSIYMPMFNMFEVLE